MYIIENQLGGYITSGPRNNIIITGNKKKARLFETKEKATNVAENLPKTISQSGEFIVTKFTSETSKPSIKSTVKKDLKLSHIKDSLSDIGEYSKAVLEKEEVLTSTLSRLDKELSDIDHYIEFYPLNAYEGWKMSKMRKDRLEERRKVKDELYVIAILKDMKNNNYLSRINGVAKQTYKPKVLKEMFEGKKLHIEKETDK